jgi:hypothetical protein
VCPAADELVAAENFNGNYEFAFGDCGWEC